MSNLFFPLVGILVVSVLGLFPWFNETIFGVNAVHYIWFFVFGQVITGYKVLAKKDGRRVSRKEICATFLLGAFFSLNIAPLLETRLSSSVHETTAYLAFLILMGELGIFFIMSKVLGVSLDTTAPPNKDERRKINDKTT